MYLWVYIHVNVSVTGKKKNALEFNEYNTLIVRKKAGFVVVKILKNVLTFPWRCIPT